VSFVVYDIETTGLIRGFDQILHFGAIKANADLEEVDRFECRSRLLPHVVPAPQALHLTATNIDEILSEQRPSHYEMVCEIRRTLLAWCPSVFRGYNSIRFDEEFLRQAFYQCLHPPYLTNTNGNARADALKLMRAVVAAHPNVLITPKNPEGRPVFKLAELAAANGFPIRNSHNAMADVEATLQLCRIAKEGAPDLWSRFLRFAQKAAVINFVGDEEAFVLLEYFGGQQDTHLVTRIGLNSEQPNTHYCFDLSIDVDELRNLAGEELIARLKTEPKPIRKLKVNAAPLLCPLYEASPAQLGAFTEDDLIRRASSIRADDQFVQRLVAAAQACEKVYDPSPHVEQQLYGYGFSPDSDATLMVQFHTVPWEDRPAIVSQFQDVRLRRLARRLIFIERSDLLAEDARQAMSDEVGRRLLGTAKVAGPWLTVPGAISKLDALLLEEAGADSPVQLLSYRRYLQDMHGRLTASYTNQVNS
jgi:exodeoxyribonuclease-1